MRLDFKSYSVEIDAEATRRAYEALPRTDEACTCSGCRNFSLAIGDALGEGDAGSSRGWASIPRSPPRLAWTTLWGAPTGRSSTGRGIVSAAG